jgi:hypothetical protein
MAQPESTTQLTAVQLSDARDEIVKNHKGIATLTATGSDALMIVTGAGQ